MILIHVEDQKVVFLMRFLNLVHCDMHSRSYNFSILKLLIFFFLISGSSLLLKMEPSCDDHWSFFVVEKKHLTYMWFLFLVIYTTTFLMINPKKNEKKICEKNTRISVFGAHDLRKKDTEKNPILRSARETQALSRLKNIHHPLPILQQLQKKIITYFLRY